MRQSPARCLREGSTPMDRTIYECHGHIMMNGRDLTTAQVAHASGPNAVAIAQALADLQQAGVTYFRDGGDPFGASQLAKTMAPAYGIDFVTPVFAIYRQGRYGSNVGYGYRDESTFRELLEMAAQRGCDYIKLVVSGRLTFKRDHPISSAPLGRDEIHILRQDLIDERGAVRPPPMGQGVNLPNHVVRQHQAV